MQRKHAETIGLAATFLLVAPPAFAYLDPGSGSMVLQVILAAVAGALVSIKLAWHRIKAFVTSPFASRETSKAETDQHS